MVFTSLFRRLHQRRIACGAGLSSWTYLLGQSEVLTHYLRLALWPAGLCLSYKWPVPGGFLEVWPNFVFITSLLIGSMYLAVKRPHIGFVALSFFIVLGPTSSVIPIRDLAFEHRMYLPLASLVTFVVTGLIWLTTIRLPNRIPMPLLLGLFYAVAVVLAVVTFQRNTVYQSDLALWSDTVNKAPDNDEAWSSLGTSYASLKQYDSAREAFSRAVSLNPYDAKTRASLGGLLLDAGDLASAESHLLRSLEMDPVNELATMNLGNLRLEQGRPQEAAQLLQQLLPDCEKPEEVRLSLSAAYLSMGDYYQAAEQCRAILEENSESVDARINLACALNAMHRLDEAVKEIERALEIAPDNANALGTLAALIRPTDSLRAKAALQKALSIAPDSPDFNLALADIYFQVQPAEAIPYYEAALKQRPDDVSAHLNVAMALDLSGKQTRLFRT